jgi:hypothetical protein
MGMLVIFKDWGVFQETIRNGMELNTGKILVENLVWSAFHQTLGDEFTFQQDNSLKHKTKSTQELLTKKTVNVSEWPGCNLDLNIQIYGNT